MTGFDVPCCSTIYLDKPQRNHTLMQTIARANRVFGDKINGLIVDYIGIFRNLERALAIYAEGTDPEGADPDGSKPIQDKSELVNELRRVIDEIKAFCASLDVDLDQTDAADTETFERIRLINDAVDNILVNDETKLDYLQRAIHIYNLNKAIRPDPAANEFNQICRLINIIAQKIKNLIPPHDTSEVREAIEDLLNRSIIPTSYAIDDDADTQPIVDLSKIDFDQLWERFRTERKHIEVERLRGAIGRKLSEMIPRNRTRMDYQERFEQMIAAYNEAAINVDVLFDQLMDLARELNEEVRRAITERLSEEELAVFDLLTRPAPELTETEKDEVKAIARKLLTMLRQEKLVLDWRKRERSRAAVKIAVQKILDEMLPECYTKAIYDQKCEVVYQHIYECYYGEGRSIYENAA